MTKSKKSNFNIHIPSIFLDELKICHITPKFKRCSYIPLDKSLLQFGAVMGHSVSELRPLPLPPLYHKVGKVTLWLYCHIVTYTAPRQSHLIQSFFVQESRNCQTSKLL